MKTSRLVYMAAALAVAFIAGGARIAAEGTTVTFTAPFPPTFWDECNGQTVTMTGGHSVSVSYARFPDGAVDMLFKTATAGHGTDLLLRSYQVSDTYESEAHFRDDHDVQTIEFDTHVIGPLTGDNFMLHSVAHFTIVNGVPTADTFDITSRCQ